MSDVSTFKNILNVFRFRKDGVSGMHTDMHPSQQPQNTYRNAWGVSNSTTEEKAGGLFNGAGQQQCAKLPAGFIERGKHLLEERDQLVLFLYNPDSKMSEIGYTQDCKYHKVIDDNDIRGCKMDFGMNEWIPIESKYLRNGTCHEVHLYWARNKTAYTLNMDRPCVPIECDELKLFNCKCLTTPNAYPSEKGGHDLEAGAYQYFVQLEDEDHNKTNFFNISNPIYIGSKNNRAGEISEHAIHVTVDNLHPDYPKINLAVIKTIGGAKTAMVIAQLGYSQKGISFFHRSKSQHLYDLTIEEVLTKKPGYIRPEDIFQYDRRLYLFNTLGVRDPDMQARILSSVKTRYKVGRVPMRYAHMFRGMQHDAVYSYKIWYNYCDNTTTRAYHIGASGIPPRGGEGCGECQDKNQFNNSTPIDSSITGHPYVNKVTKSPDTYDPFTPTDQGLLTAEDFELPDDDQFLPEEPGGEGNDCACWAAQAANNRLIRIHNGIPVFAPYATAYQTLKDLCESGCAEGAPGGGGNLGGGGGGILEPRSDNEQSLDNSGCNCFDANDLSDITAIYNAELGINADPDITNEGLIAWWQFKSGMGYSDEDCPDCPDPGDPPTLGGQKDSRFKIKEDFQWNNNPEKPSTPQINSSVGNDNNYQENSKHTGSVYTSATAPRNPVIIKDCEPTIIYSDDDCCTIKEIIPCIDSEGELSIYESCELYPDEERCCGEGKTYGDRAGKPIQHHRMPSIAQQPHFISYHDGVPTSEDRGNHEYNNSFARFIWPEFSGIPIPSPDEIDKPLCPINPFTIGWQLRDEASDTVIASGVLFGTFAGQTLGEDMLFPNLGANSDVKADRWVRNANGSHVGTESNIPAYTFHSPDTAFDRPSLNGDYMHDCLQIEGEGWRHHLYAEGPEPASNYVGRCNRKGASQSINLNKWETQQSDDKIHCLVSASYVPANSVLSKNDEFSKSLVNLNRESTVYLETDGPKIPMQDDSFGLDTHTHQRNLTGLAHYVSLNKFIPNAYGGVANAICHPLWQGKAEHIQADGTATVLVRDGDTFINYWSFKRTSYVTDHVPTNIVPPYEFGAGITLKFPFGNILKALFKSISANCQCGTVPESGRTNDPRNRTSRSGGDDWFPQVQTTLISVPVESKVNLGYQGSGDEPAQSTYRDLNGQVFDSSFEGGMYENAWMDRFYATMCENPKWKCLFRVIANLLFTYGFGIYLIVQGFLVMTDSQGRFHIGVSNTILAVVAMGLGIILTLCGFIWIIAWANTDTDNRMIDNLIGMKDCFPDKRPQTPGDGHARMHDHRVQGLEDNHYEYNYDYSETNRIQIVLGLPNPFDPCHCPEETTYEILYSNAQDPTSQRDAYKNFEANAYFLVPSHHGKLKKMFLLGNSAYVQTTDVMFQVQAGNVELQTNGSNVYLESTGRMLQHPINMFGGIPEGRGGTRDPNACEVTKFGYINVDVEAREIAIFTGNNYHSLREDGMASFLDNFMSFEAIKTNPDIIRDEKTPDGIGISLGMDNARNILFITKHDKKNGKPYNWTLAYHLESNSWLGFEYFHPLVYAWDRHQMWSFHQEYQWTHNKVGEYLTVYGKSVPMIVDFVINDPETMDSFKWNNSVIDAQIDTWDDHGFISRKDIFFTEIGVHNSYQTSGLLPVIIKEELTIQEKSDENNNVATISNLSRRWRLSKFVDKSVQRNMRLFSTWRDETDTPFFTDFNEEALGPVRTGNAFIDNYMVVRLVFQGDANVRILLKQVISRVNAEQL